MSKQDPATIGYHIDPAEGTVQHVMMRAREGRNYLKHLYALCDCDLVTTAYLDNGTDDAVFVDDEGLLKAMSPFDFFALSEQHESLKGPGVVMGRDAHGNSTSPATSWEAFKASGVARVLLFKRPGDTRIQYLYKSFQFIDAIREAGDDE
ncbi:hypothetical protein [Cupriavidus taiwanensis]|uniref:hypothetical protein n=1 Tax=Cupriavidus taiwanensis TaxID=164546 RepID=UPI000E1323C6|nr:hypothetical protein [Cupriavidus taiwanensis]SPA17241.1 hypothetical protein CBM2631_A90317 [Cupriavidus taiwanensis]